MPPSEWTIKHTVTCHDCLGPASDRSASGLCRACLLQRRKVQRILGYVPIQFAATYGEIGEAMGFSRERARQLEVSALRKLKRAFARCGVRNLSDILG